MPKPATHPTKDKIIANPRRPDTALIMYAAE
jgi:hypothetical protein